MYLLSMYYIRQDSMLFLEFSLMIATATKTAFLIRIFNLVFEKLGISIYDLIKVL